MAKDDKVVPAKRKKLARKEAEAFAGGIPSGMTPNGHFHQGHSLLSSSSAPAPGSRPLISSSAPPSSCRYAALGTHPTALQGVTHQQRGESLQFRPGKIVYKPHKLPPKPSPATLDAAPGNSWTHPHRRAQSQGASTGGVYGQELGYAGGAYGGAGGSASSASMGGHGGDDDARAPGGGGPANGFCMGMNAAEFAAIWAAPVPNLQASTSNATGKTKKSRRGPSDRRSRRGGYEEDNFGSSITNRKKIKKCKGKDNDKGKGKAVQGSTSSARGASPPPSSRGGALAAHHDQQQLVANSEDVDKFAIPRQKARVALSFGSLTTEDGEKLLEKICAGKEAAKVDLQRLVRDVVVQRNSRAAKQDIDDLVEIIIEISLELVIGHQGDAVPFASTICDRIFDRLEEWGTELRDLIVKTADSYLLLVGAPSLSQFLARSQGAGPPPSTAASAAAPSQPQHVDNNVAPLPVPQHPFPQPIANPSQQAPSPPQPALEAPIINHQQAPYFSQQFDQADFDVQQFGAFGDGAAADDFDAGGFGGVDSQVLSFSRSSTTTRLSNPRNARPPNHLPQKLPHQHLPTRRSTTLVKRTPPPGTVLLRSTPRAGSFMMPSSAALEVSTLTCTAL